VYKIYIQWSAKNPQKIYISSRKSGNSLPNHHSSPDLRGGNISSKKMLRIYMAIRPASGFYTYEAPNSLPLTVKLFGMSSEDRLCWREVSAWTSYAGGRTWLAALQRQNAENL
jgi:hypothetical protein